MDLFSDSLIETHRLGVLLALVTQQGRAASCLLTLSRSDLLTLCPGLRGAVFWRRLELLWADCHHRDLTEESAGLFKVVIIRLDHTRAMFAALTLFRDETLAELRKALQARFPDAQASMQVRFINLWDIHCCLVCSCGRARQALWSASSRSAPAKMHVTLVRSCCLTKPAHCSCPWSRHMCSLDWTTRFLRKSKISLEPGFRLPGCC